MMCPEFKTKHPRRKLMCLIDTQLEPVLYHNIAGGVFWQFKQ